MALRLGTLKCAAEGNNGFRLGTKRWAHVASMASPLDGALESSIASPQFILPEFDANQDTSDNGSDFGFRLPGFSVVGSMELMAVPKRKTTPHKRGHTKWAKGIETYTSDYSLQRRESRNTRVTSLAETMLRRTEIITDTWLLEQSLCLHRVVIRFSQSTDGASIQMPIVKRNHEYNW
ncbi:unnamed protein product [Dovyalis caffra]|uniref:Uncharacterized protein n=1 Tax=Dovyalis caffra TaxID=77055 RepID=A0AAV1R171_9ROSI|nr:unnamed protein product [Dovyalis caffra]